MGEIQKKLKVLYIEDEAKWLVEVREMVRELEGLEFCEVPTMHKFDEAMYFVEGSQPDIVILDHAVDGFCGYHIAHELKNMDEYDDVTMISFSGSVTETIRSKYPARVHYFAEKDLGKLRRYLRGILREAGLG